LPTLRNVAASGSAARLRKEFDVNARTLVLVTGVAFAIHIAAAQATVIDTVTVSYTHWTSNQVGNAPGITYSLANPFSFSTTSPLSAHNFLTTSPAGSCGSGCVNNTASLQINFHFSLTDSLGGTGTLDTFATYEAKYSGAALSCSDSPAGQTDCIDWNGAPATWNGSITDSIYLTDGAIASLTFYNAEDWTITSQISGNIAGPNNVPEPASLALLATGLLGLAMIRRRRSA
jgi:hypothetical protein